MNTHALHVLALTNRCIIAVIVASAFVGCTRQVGLSSWQDSVERYVRDEGDGDPASLRDVTLPDSRRGFAAIGDANPESSSDVFGVLLDHRELEDRHWFIYLVGHVRNLAVVDIRVAAVSFGEGKTVWRMSERNAEELATYCAFHQEEYTRRFAPLAPPQSRSAFPQPGDSFIMAVEAPTVVVTHEGSNATWRLDLAEAD
jgi:hypothetical protein